MAAHRLRGDEPIPTMRCFCHGGNRSSAPVDGIARSSPPSICRRCHNSWWLRSLLHLDDIPAVTVHSSIKSCYVLLEILVYLHTDKTAFSPIALHLPNLISPVFAIWVKIFVESRRSQNILFLRTLYIHMLVGRKPIASVWKGIIMITWLLIWLYTIPKTFRLQQFGVWGFSALTYTSNFRLGRMSWKIYEASSGRQFLSWSESRHDLRTTRNFLESSHSYISFYLFWAIWWSHALPCFIYCHDLFIAIKWTRLFLLWSMLSILQQVFPNFESYELYKIDLLKLIVISDIFFPETRHIIKLYRCLFNIIALLIVELIR